MSSQLAPEAAALCKIDFKPGNPQDFAPPAMRLFKAHRVAESLVAFYQFWRCPNVAAFNGLNPLVEDQGLLPDFDRAAVLGAAGRYDEGIRVLQSIVRRYGVFVEARLLLGVFEYVKGDRLSALRTWRAAEHAGYYPVPFPPPYPVQIGLRELISLTSHQ